MSPRIFFVIIMLGFSTAGASLAQEGEEGALIEPPKNGRNLVKAHDTFSFKRYLSLEGVEVNFQVGEFCHAKLQNECLNIDYKTEQHASRIELSFSNLDTGIIYKQRFIFFTAENGSLKRKLLNPLSGKEILMEEEALIFSDPFLCIFDCWKGTEISTLISLLDEKATLASVKIFPHKMQENNFFLRVGKSTYFISGT